MDASDRSSDREVAPLKRARFLLILSVSVIAGACDPGWATVVRNDTDQEQFLRFFDGPSIMVSVAPSTGGLLGIGNAPGPRSVDLVDRDCQVLSTVAVAEVGDTLIVIRAEGGVPAAVAAPTTLPRTIENTRLEVVPGVCKARAAADSGRGTPRLQSSGVLEHA